jgi:hypothetical protein
LTKTIDPTGLVNMSSKDLAPSHLKNLREVREKKYFEEQVLLKDQIKVITKSHKGVDYIQINE